MHQLALQRQKLCLPSPSYLQKYSTSEKLEKYCSFEHSEEISKFKSTGISEAVEEIKTKIEDLKIVKIKDDEIENLKTKVIELLSSTVHSESSSIDNESEDEKP